MWQSLLHKTDAEYAEHELEFLVRKLFNGREVRTLCFHLIVIQRLNYIQIKNIVTMASRVAKHENRRLSLPQLEAACRMREEFEGDFRGPGAVQSDKWYA